MLASQALTVNDVTLAFDIQVTIEHDPNDFRFPPEADSYEVTVSLDKALVYTTSGAIDPPGGQRTQPIVATITDIPSGGNVTVEVVLKNAAGWIAATAAAGPLAATPEAAGQMTLAVKNRLVPLTAQTQYQHDLELQYQSGAHIWVKTTPGPSATRSALQCAENDTLCQLSQITISPRTGSIGYAWRTGGLGVGECYSGRHDVLYAFQNIFGAAPPDSALKFPGCGFMLPAGLAYDPQGPPNGSGRNFYFEPAADGDGYYLRSVVLDDTTPFNLASGMNWGRFTQRSTRSQCTPTVTSSAYRRRLTRSRCSDCRRLQSRTACRHCRRGPACVRGSAPVPAWSTPPSPSPYTRASCSSSSKETTAFRRSTSVPTR